MTEPSPTRIEFSAPLSLEECERRLREAVDTRLFDFLPESDSARKGVVGTISRNSFKLQRRGDRYDRNSFAPVLVGSMQSAGGETSVTAKFRMLLFTLVFVPIFLFLTLSFVDAGFAAKKAGFGWFPVAVPLVIAASPFLIYAGTRRRAMRQRAYLREFLLTTLEAPRARKPLSPKD